MQQPDCRDQSEFEVRGQQEEADSNRKQETSQDHKGEEKDAALVGHMKPQYTHIHSSYIIHTHAHTHAHKNTQKLPLLTRDVVCFCCKCATLLRII